MSERAKNLLVVLAIMVLVTGCVSNKRHNRELGNLQSQVNMLSSEVARLDSQVTAPKGLFGTPQPASSAPKASSGYVSSAMYRTPGGFEVPAADIQRALIGAGYYNGDVDGKIGPKTREAIRAFQQDNGLKADGVCGRKTWDLLSKHLSSDSKTVIK